VTAGADEAVPADPVAYVRERFAGYGPPVPAILAALERVQVARTDEVVLPRWSRGPVLLVGDAAHATSPTLAEGAAMAFEDAAVLAEVLRAGADVPTALAAYEKRRRPRTDWVRVRTRDRDRLRAMPTPLHDALLRRRGEHLFRGHYEGLVTPV